MIRLTCPHCGERDFTEFSFRAEATVTRPGQDETSAEVWMDYLYNRENPRGGSTVPPAVSGSRSCATP